MNCADWEERVALHAGGDLAGADVERHLAECGACSELERDLQGSLAGLREAHEAPVEAADYAVVRARVLAEIDRRARSGWWGWAWAAGVGAAAVGLLWLAVAARITPSLPPPGPIHAAIPPAVVQVARRAVPLTLRRPRRPRRPPSEPARPLMVQLVTDDPSVVIYWIAEKGGE